MYVVEASPEEEAPAVEAVLQLVVLAPGPGLLVYALSAVAALVVEQRVADLSPSRQCPGAVEVVDVGPACLEVEALGLAIGGQSLEGCVVGLLIGRLLGATLSATRQLT